MNTFNSSPRLKKAIANAIADNKQRQLAFYIAAEARPHRRSETEETLAEAIASLLVAEYGYKPRIITFVYKVFDIMRSVGE